MKTALLFAGQGSQAVGMGRDLCEKHDVCRRLFGRANEVLGRDIQKICFEGPEDVLTKTDNAQPGIFLTSLACFAQRTVAEGCGYRRTGVAPVSI